MEGPENEKYYGRMKYATITPPISFVIKNSFWYEEGAINYSAPISKVTIVFITTESGTLVEFKMFYFSEKKMENMSAMDFEQDITAVHEQLERLF